MTDRELLQMALDDLLHVSDGLECLETIAALQDRLAQPEPEPFGWYNAEHDEIITNSWYMEQRKKNPSDDSGFSIPLYTTPQYTKLDPVGYHYRGRFSTEKNAPGIGIYGVPVYTAPQQPEPESVGNTITFMTQAIFNVIASHQEINGGYFIADGDVDAFVDRLAKVINSTFEPLKHKDSAPPKKEWVGLTNDAIEYIVDAYWDDPPMFIEAIEAKLKKENDF
jgi:hypothetical protein